MDDADDITNQPIVTTSIGRLLSLVCTELNCISLLSIYSLFSLKRQHLKQSTCRILLSTCSLHRFSTIVDAVMQTILNVGDFKMQQMKLSNNKKRVTSFVVIFYSAGWQRRTLPTDGRTDGGHSLNSCLLQEEEEEVSTWAIVYPFRGI
jgi:hypothetical protein